MAGTKAGGQKAAAKNLAKDPSFYAKIGAKGGRNGHTGGFAANPDLARLAGAKGGRISRRRKTAVVTADSAVKSQDDVALAA
jgi:general stress protein YciG